MIGLIKLGLRVEFFFIERNENIDSDRYNIVDGILNFVVLEYRWVVLLKCRMSKFIFLNILIS